uniref:Kinesin motor domain-containing protein n=1 Tax=Skeletonema marinoi TaxID=267567 RepID=A0A7S2KM86_9STRA|mmetsp:Transcript_13956/g.23359  ORF Transcript_13956/g.23359 Transcript_13956/m.23359 type:complete len:549 (+) Transcript_13956:78-1724(+)
MMQTTSSRRIVQSKSSSESSSSSSSPKVAYNKENNGSDSESFPQGVYPNDGTRKIVRVKASASNVTKKVMSASELLAKQGWSSKQQFAAPTNDETATLSSYDMKYSSISPPEQRCPSARTITNQCFTTLDESVDEASLSSESFRIKEEMNNVYESSPMAPSYIKSPSKNSSMDEVDSVYENSPIPSTYMNSPSKMSSAEEVNSVYENSPIQSKKMPDKQQQPVVPKKRMDASVWLKKSQPKARSAKTSGVSSSTIKAYGASTNRSLSSADASFKTKGRGGNNSNKPSRRSSLSTPKNNRAGKVQPMALAVQREKQQRHKVNAEADSNETRTCLDKRTARLRYGKDFKADVLQHRQQHPRLNNGTNHSDKAGSQIHDRSLNGVSIVVRKRPIFDFEQSRGDYDVVSIDNSSSTMDTCIIDNCVMHADMKTKLVKPLFFPAQAAFDEHCSNDDIYKNIAEPLVNNTVKEGVVATLLLYGQTGETQPSTQPHTSPGNHSCLSFLQFQCCCLIIFYVIPTSPRMWQILYHVWDRGEDSERDLPSHCFSTCFK